MTQIATTASCARAPARTLLASLTAVAFLLSATVLGARPARAQSATEGRPVEQTGSATPPRGVERAESPKRPRKKKKDRKLRRKEIEALIAALPEKHRQFLDDVELLISPEERDAFLEIEQSYQRDAFIERFWRVRDPYPDSPRNEFRDNWYQRVEVANRLFGGERDDRARHLLLNGAPDARIVFTCGTVVNPLEVWFYQRSERVGYEFFLVFVRKYGLQRYVLWHPSDPTSDLLAFSGGGGNIESALEDIYTCKDGEIVAAALVRLLRRPMEYDMLIAKLEQPKESPSPEWVATFASYSTDLPEGAPELTGELAVSYPTRHQSRTVLEGLVTLQTDGVGLAELADSRSFNLQLTGEVLRGDGDERELFESFRYRFDFPASEIPGDEIPILFERRLRPGAYELVVKVEDLNSPGVFRRRLPIDVPAIATAAELPADSADRRILDQATAAIGTDRPTLELVEPHGHMLTGMVRFDTLTTGEIDEVRFVLDDEVRMTRRKPPFSVELDLGRVPRSHRLRASAHDADGRELASDELTLNAGRNSFRVRFVEPRPEGKHTGTVQVRLDVKTPDDVFVERVELLYNETPVATLYQPPFAQKVQLPASPELGYLQAVAYLPDGNSTSDLVYVNAPDYLENVEIQYVELYASVLDKQSRPVLGLERDAFSVAEDGVAQEIRRFEEVSDLPVHMLVMIDVSASMVDDLPSTQQAALAFFQQALTPRDRAAIVTFNDHPHLAVDLTNDVTSLAGGLAGLKAERGTALYDSLIFSLYLLNGIKGQRAILLLSDGQDESSRFSFEDTLEYARRAGVAIYAIGLNLSGKGAGAAKRKLTNVSDTTGGRSFFIKSTAELDRVYRQIQIELRSRYLITYQSTNDSTGNGFRAIDLRAARPGVEVKTISGYYP